MLFLLLAAASTALQRNSTAPIQQRVWLSLGVSVDYLDRPRVDDTDPVTNSYRPPLLLLGLTRTFELLVPHLNPRLRVISVGIRGVGASDGTAEAADVRAFIDALSLRLVYLGGSFVANSVATHWPRVVSKLVTLSSCEGSLPSSQDGLFPPEVCSDRLRAFIPTIRSHLILPGVGNAIGQEAPAAVAEVINRFLLQEEEEEGANVSAVFGRAERVLPPPAFEREDAHAPLVLGGETAVRGGDGGGGGGGGDGGGFDKGVGGHNATAWGPVLSAENTRPSGIFPGTVHPSGVSSGTVYLSGIASVSAHPSGITSGSAHFSGISFGSVHPSGMFSGSVHPSGISSGSVHPTDIASGSAHPSGISSGKLHPSGIASGAAHPSGISSGSVHPSGISSGSVHPTDIAFGSAHPSGISSGSVHPSGNTSGSAHPSGISSPTAWLPSLSAGCSVPAASAAQSHFTCGLRLAIGFDFLLATEAFRCCTLSSPDCAMCHWGVAWSLGPRCCI